MAFHVATPGIGLGSNSMTINGRRVVGQSITVTQDGKLIVDGEPYHNDRESTRFEIVIYGDVQGGIHLPYGQIEVHGSVGMIETASSNVTIEGNVEGSVRTMSGSITVSGSVGGSISSMSGSVVSSKRPGKADDEKISKPNRKKPRTAD